MAGGGEMRGALEKAREPTSEAGFVDDVAARLADQLLDLGIDGKGTFASAATIADNALAAAGGDAEQAVAAVIRRHTAMAGASGFATGVGGFFTLPVALPANVLGFYLLATRMTAAVARLRGHDIADPHIRTAVLLTLIGADADDLLRKAGAVVPAGRMTNLAAQRLPGPALMVVNKGIAFRVIATASRTGLTKLGRFVPVVGGAVGGGLDAWMVRRIADHARREFPVSSVGRLGPA
ncbi:MAG: EcsC family protein [Dermatophilaceae bacterium]